MDLFKVVEAQEVVERKGDFSVSNQIEKVVRRTKKNDTIASYCDDLADDYIGQIENYAAHVAACRRLNDVSKGICLPMSDNGRDFLVLVEERYADVYRKRAERLRTCCRKWYIDHYRSLALKDLKQTNLCRDRFCDNCQNALAIQRQERFRPLLEDLSQVYDIYHVVFTVPNCEGFELSETIDRMFKCFSRLMNFFRLNNKINGISFVQYGFVGAVRALEVTKNSSDQTFHPHLHCLFLLCKGSRLTHGKRFLNQFSYDREHLRRHHDDEKPRYFTAFEILLQKIWYLLFNAERVTYEAITLLKQGYSVIVDRAKPGQYHEVFKYATKGVFKPGGGTAGFYDFIVLDRALHGRRIIQGYGVLNRFDLEGELDLSADQLYQDFIDACRNLDIPSKEFEMLSQIRSNMKKGTVRYISRSSVRTFLGGACE